MRRVIVTIAIMLISLVGIFACELHELCVDLDNLRTDTNQRYKFLTSVVSGLNSAVKETIITTIDGDNKLNREVRELQTKMSDTLNLSVLDSCGIITNGEGHGSCVAIRPNLMLTAGHCIGIDGTWVEVNGQRYEILRQWKDEQHDVGFVEIEGELPFVELGQMPKLLDEVFLVGSPYNVLFERTITKGIISHLERNIYGRIGLIQTDAEGAPGSSGCPLFCEQGRIVGICVAGPQPGGGVTLCVPVEQIKEALNRFIQGNDPI